MLNTDQVGALADPPVSRVTVWREIDRGNLPAQKIGGVWVVDEGDARKWAAGFQSYAGLRGHRSPRGRRRP